MVYDGLPLVDHFKKVGDGTLLAITNGKVSLDNGRHYYFILDRV